MAEQNSDDLRMGVLYIRVSPHDQDELSPDAQRRVLLDYAKNNRILLLPNLRDILTLCL